MFTPHQTQFFAWQLTRRLSSEDEDKLTGAIMDAQIDLNPHQVNAALFAFRNPLNKGVLLADEVGLGKTIEAGLVIAQKWAERKRRILIIVPANLRKQWHQELQEKFGVEGQILESASYNQAKKAGVRNPFDIGEGLVICSYQFASAKADDLRMVPWDLAVIDEAHRLRNVYKKTNKIAKTLKDALAPTEKVLLTATPLQNSLLELYGLVSILDDKIFGDLDSFRSQYGRITDPQTFASLKQRIAPVCKRTLRQQVQAYVSYTRRIPLVQTFTPSSDEQRLYSLVSEYLRRPELNALPSGQRQLISMVMWKLLASSSFAIAGALGSIVARLERTLAQAEPDDQQVIGEIQADYEALEETAEEWEEEPVISAEERESILAEIEELKGFKALAENIRHNSKGEALLKALNIGFDKLAELGANEKAIIFTESRKTQNYLMTLLGNSQHKNGIVLFNGTNNDPQARQIYREWLEQHQGSDRITGSRTADTRAALVDYFRGKGRIMIATEAAAEGVNLQFCSLVINYDLPWNPQRIEQRIGRCHRYGQKHDVVVLNFIDLSNEADRRVYELLDQKFNLFNGVFGASDEVLGAIESGVDLERRIKQIYQTCRESEQINAAFQQLQLELAHEINAQMVNTREQLFEHFDEDVLQKIKIDSTASLDRYERMLLDLTKGELQGHIRELEGGFILNDLPPHAPPGIPLGEYELPRREGETHIYRLRHPLAQWLIALAKGRDLPPAKLVFDYRATTTQIAVVRELQGQSGQLAAHLVTVNSLARSEDHIVLCGHTDSGETLHQEVLEKLLSFPVSQSLPVTQTTTLDQQTAPSLTGELARRKTAILAEVNQRNLKYFEAEVDKLDAWADDLKVGLEQEIKEIDREIREVRRTAKAAPDLNEKLHWQKRQRELEKLRTRKRRELFDKQDEVDNRREGLIAELEDKLEQKVEERHLFSIYWQVI
ncbi:MAG: DEAD/DEAH box helicase [Gammaproteobacteria bacterium BRH_c0]|nr:MAG: DEAD/DEAH box helicase [Gammaproteobacteria bacterium BRH_c0]